jgi:hypothetical protein
MSPSREIIADPRPPAGSRLRGFDFPAHIGAAPRATVPLETENDAGAEGGGLDFRREMNRMLLGVVRDLLSQSLKQLLIRRS